MRLTTCLASLATAFVLCGPAAAQPPDRRGRDGRSDVFRMEILNGSSRTVRYFDTGLSPGESSTLREAEALENERGYARDLADLKRQYVLSERLLEPHRRQVQRALYGLDITQASFATDFGMSPAFGIYARGAPGFNTFLFNPWSGGGQAVPVGGSEMRVRRSLADGVGDEGRMKEALAAVIARQASAEYVTLLERASDRVAVRAGGSEPLRVALGLPRKRDGIRAAADDAAPVTLTLKGGDQVRGESLRETKDWFIVTRTGGGEVRVRAAEVVRVETTKKGVVGAAGD